MDPIHRGIDSDADGIKKSCPKEKQWLRHQLRKILQVGDLPRKCTNECSEFVPDDKRRSLG